jgi:hypothetical protein
MPSTELVARPKPADIEAVEGDLYHRVCEVHELVALCGETFTVAEYRMYSMRMADESIDCPLCGDAILSGVVCAVPGCNGQPSRPGLLRRIFGGRRA